MKTSEIKSKELKKIMGTLNETKVLVYKTIQTIEEEQYYKVDEATYNALKNATTDKEKLAIWSSLDIWNDSELVGEHTDSWTKEEVSHGTHKD
tara:strand:- start:103 stop:381 length:279 start_codon:yes stop_codon:yes gene_type:complete